VVGSQIETLMSVLDVRNEYELSAKLGLSRSAVSQWKKRGAVPARFHHLIASLGDDAAMEATHQQIFRKPEYHYWLRSALVLAPPLEARSDPSGERRERLIVDLMALAMRVTRQDLGLSRIRDEGAWQRLMDRMGRAHGEEIETLVSQYGG
jgi:hypothetical protein